MNIRTVITLICTCGILTAHAATPVAKTRNVRSPRVTPTKTEKKQAEIAEAPSPDVVSPADTLNFTVNVDGDTIHLEVAPEFRSGRLTEDDYREVAEELGVEVAAIKAVVEIEAGRSHQGFWTDGKPIINFDLTVFRQAARRHGVKLGKYSRSHSIVFSRPNSARYGGQQAAVQARLDAARSIHDAAGIEGTFWGMFQIGGFNWKKCGAASPAEFVKLMSRSERDQLELFAKFITSTGLLGHLRNKNWAAFARGYNGNSYAARGYHTRMAAAYKRYKNS